MSNNIYNIWPPGHFYSPIPDIEAILEKRDKIYKNRDMVPGVDLNDEGQLQLFSELTRFYQGLPFKDEKQKGLRYYYKNNFYSYGDAIILFCLMNHLKPKNIIEIGSGFSSAVLLDTNELFFNGSARCTFIEPYPDRLLSLLDEKDPEHTTLIKSKLEDTDLSIFSSLSENDILFIDSSHVSKIDSDVNHIIFNILPLLKKGVYIHFHDIFYPFEYPIEWLSEGRFWNEAYLLRAFLQYNDTFKIKLFLSHFYGKYSDIVNKYMPLYVKCPGGALWIKKEK
jgi:hypothetical protein